MTPPPAVSFAAESAQALPRVMLASCERSLPCAAHLVMVRGMSLLSLWVKAARRRLQRGPLGSRIQRRLESPLLTLSSVKVT